MNQASPAELHKALEAVSALFKVGIMFIPVPVLDDDDKAVIGKLANDQLELAATMAEEAEGKS